MLTVKQVAERLNCSIATVYSLIDSGTLACVRIGSRGGGIRVTPEDLQAFIESRRSQSPPPPQPKRPRPVLKHLRL